MYDPDRRSKRMALDKDELEKVMTKANIGTRSKKKMHEANDADGSEPKKSTTTPLGHGAPAPHKAVIDEI